MRSHLLLSLAAPFVLLAVCAGCGGSDPSTDPALFEGSGSSSSGSSGATAGGGTGGGSLGLGTGGSTGGPAGPSVIYAHTDTTLFKLDPTSKDLALTKVGDFDCIGTGAGQDSAMTDFAVNAKLEIWGISGHDVHPLTLLGDVVHCEPQIALKQANVRFYGLTYAPIGVLDGQKEVLVAGNTAGELWSIDGSGALQQRGSLGVVPADDGNGNKYQNAGKTWELSGDIVFLANHGDPVGFAMVRDCPNPPDTAGCSYVNTLLELDVQKLATATTEGVTKAVRGQILSSAGCNDGVGGQWYGNMYGIAAWNDKVYGFSRSGNLVQINTTDGTGCLVQSYADNKFAGAGVTTNAPVTVPPPK